MTPEFMQFIFPLLGSIAGGVGVYAAIRADLSNLQARVIVLENSHAREQTRIDGILTRGGMHAPSHSD